MFLKIQCQNKEEVRNGHHNEECKAVRKLYEVVAIDTKYYATEEQCTKVECVVSGKRSHEK